MQTMICAKCQRDQPVSQFGEHVRDDICWECTVLWGDGRSPSTPVGILNVGKKIRKVNLLRELWAAVRIIRKLMDEDGGPLSGEVEIDETHVGGSLKNRAHVKHVDAFSNKIPVVGAVERGGRVNARVVRNVRKSELLPLVIEKVMPDATVFTDELKSYSQLGPKHGYAHHRVNHRAKVYVRGNVHTNTIEGFWSLLKNGIRGAHHAVGATYLQSYVNEYAFRYNHRDDTAPMFTTLGNQVVQVRHGRYGKYAPVGE